MYTRTYFFIFLERISVGNVCRVDSRCECGEEPVYRRNLEVFVILVDCSSYRSIAGHSVSV